jgi:NAD+ synthase
MTNKKIKTEYRKIKLAQINLEETIADIGHFILNKVIEHHKTGVVIGLSGGLDSTVVAYLAKTAFDKYNSSAARHGDQEFELLGYCLPSKINDKKDEEDGLSVAKRLGIKCDVVSIESKVESHKDTNPEHFLGTSKAIFDLGNAMSEMRAVVLHGKGASYNKAVIGTGNRDEDSAIGYYTLFGDGAVHMSPIAGLPKRIVRQIAEYGGFKDIAQKVPSAGLEPGQTDFKDLGYGYDVVELLYEGQRQGFTFEELKSHPQVVEMVDHQLKQYQGMYGVNKFDDVSGVVNDYVRRNNTAKNKAKLLSPDVAPINLIYQ